MADNAVYLVSTGLTTLVLTGTDEDILLGGYKPEAPRVRTDPIPNTLEDGGEVGGVYYDNVTEVLELLIKDDTPAAVQIWYNLLEEMLERARRRQRNKRINPVYLTHQWAGEAVAWRSEILYGQMTLIDESLGTLPLSHMKCRMIITRRYFWERATEIEVALDNTSTVSGVTGGVTIYNHNDGGGSGVQVNYVDTFGAIAGTLPAPVRLVVKNTAGATVAYSNIYVGLNRNSSPLNFDHIIEGEDNETTGGTDTADANSSGTSYYARTWTPSITHSTILYVFTLSGTQLEHANGGYFRILARLTATPNATTYVKVGVYVQSVIKLMETPEMKLDADLQLQDLGVIQLPPALSGLSTLGDLTLKITARDTQAGSLSIDFIQLTPLDGYRHLRTLGGNYAANTEIVDDGIEGQLYSDEGGTDVYPMLTATGRPLMLVPGESHRFYILFDEATTMNTARTSSVRLYYRPRRTIL